MLTIAWAGHDALGVQRCVSEGVGTGAIKLAGAWSCARSRVFKARVWAGHDALGRVSGLGMMPWVCSAV